MSEQTLEQVMGEVPEAAPVTDQPVAVDNEQTEPVTPTEQPSEEEQHKTRVQKRIDQLTRDKYELKARLEKLEAVQNKANEPQRPTREGFASDEDYIDALTDYKIDQRMQAAPKQDNTNVEWATRIAETRNSHEDYDDVVGMVASITLPQLATEAIVSSKFGPEIVYALGKDPERAEQISRMSPGAAAMEIGEILADIKAKKVSQPAVKRVSSAPAPITPVQPKPTATDDPSKMSDAQFAEWRRKQIKQRGR
jgi:hypothetical protein